jgi:hypothetical protein
MLWLSSSGWTGIAIRLVLSKVVGLAPPNRL